MKGSSRMSDAGSEPAPGGGTVTEWTGGKQAPAAEGAAAIASMSGVLEGVSSRGSGRSRSDGKGAVEPCCGGEADWRSWCRYADARCPEECAEVWRQRSPLASKARWGEVPRPRPPRRGERDREEGRQRDVSAVEREDGMNSRAG